jgi:hypothetical protein
MNPCSLKSRRKTNGSALGMDELHSQTWSKPEDTETSKPFKLKKWTNKKMDNKQRNPTQKESNDQFEDEK